VQDGFSKRYDAGSVPADTVLVRAERGRAAKRALLLVFSQLLKGCYAKPEREVRASTDAAG
jgi:hypothetical protein